MKILLRRGRADPVASPQAATLADFVRPAISEEELNSEVELLRDDSLLRRVVQDLQLAPSGSSKQAILEERAVRRLARTIAVEPLRKSNLIAVRYRASTPQEAAGVLSALSRAYVERHTQLQRPNGEFQFFEQQANAYEEKLRRSEADVVRFSHERRVASPALERDIALQKLGEAEAIYRQLELQRVEVERRALALQSQLKSFPSRSVTVKRWTDNPQLLEKLKSRLLELQLKRTELLTRFEPTYRLVQEVEQQIQETRRAIAAEALAPVRDETTDKDPNYEWARMELEKTEVEQQALLARQAVASGQVAALRTNAQQMQADSIVQQGLIRAAKATEDDYLLYRRKREEARIGNALDERHILNVAAVEAPVEPALPVRPLLFWFAIALGLATSTGLVAAFVAEYFDPSIRTPSEAQELMSLPVLAWFPKEPSAAGPILMRNVHSTMVSHE